MSIKLVDMKGWSCGLSSKLRLLQLHSPISDSMLPLCLLYEVLIPLRDGSFACFSGFASFISGLDPE